jgi:hypothetical protein
MPQVIYSEKWMVESLLMQKTGLTERQIKALRLNRFVEGVHFKRYALTGGDNKGKALIWYNYPCINELIEES